MTTRRSFFSSAIAAGVSLPAMRATAFRRLVEAEPIATANPRAWVIGCDTDVYLGSDILGKPVDAEDAARLLRRIQGRTHSVWGAFALLRHESGERLIESHETLVTIAPMSGGTIRDYVACGEPLDKAGAYAAQGIGARYIESVKGSYTNVVGLNLSAFVQALYRLGIVHD